MLKHGAERNDWQAVADDSGRIVGKFWIPRYAWTSEGLAKDLQIVKSFLISLKGCQADMGKQQSNEKTNIVWLAGTLKLDPKEYSNAIGCLIETGGRAIRVSTLLEMNDAPNPLADRLRQFRKGDFIKIVAMLKAFASKDEANDRWNPDQIFVNITEIKNEPPKRAEQPRRQPQPALDDDIPF